MQKSNATTILILGIVGLVAFQLLGIVAWVMGNNTLKAMDAGQMESHDRNLAEIGRILGIICTVLIILGALVGVFMMLMVFGVFGAAAVSGAAGR